MTLIAVLAAGACLAAALALRGLWQSAVGLLAVAAVTASGSVGLDAAGAAVRGLAAVVGYLVAILAVAVLLDRAGVFAWLGGLLAGAARSGDAVRLLRWGVLAAALVTVLLTLDATVVLLVPALVAASAIARLDGWPLDLASVRLANAASILLPISNLTNLIAFDALDLGFWRFTLLMAPAWAVVVAIEYLVVLRASRAEMGRTPHSPERAEMGRTPRPPAAVLGVLTAMLGAIVLGSEVGLDPVWPTLAAVVALVLREARLGSLRSAAGAALRAAQLPFAVFVLCWGVAVAALAARGGDDLLRRVLPSSSGAPALVLIALIAMVVANLVNNLPATLLLVPLTVGLGPVAVLAVLIGVGVGAGATYAGSLANLLWLRNPAVRHPADVGRRFHTVGLIVTPASVVLATLALAGTAALVGA